MKIRVGLSKTINIGNFENLKPSIEIEDELQDFKIAEDNTIFEKETPLDCYLRLTKLCHRLLAKEIKKLEFTDTGHTEDCNKSE